MMMMMIVRALPSMPSPHTLAFKAFAYQKKKKKEDKALCHAHRRHSFAVGLFYAPFLPSDLSGLTRATVTCTGRMTARTPGNDDHICAFKCQ